MKTATITFHSAENYGAFLQAYALQTYLIKELGVGNDILNYVSGHMKEHYEIFKRPTSLKNMLRNIMLLPHAKRLRARKSNFSMAQNTYLKMTDEFNDISEYKKLVENYEVCIAGSDQIWNLDSEDFSELFFLPDAKKRISYAASAGIELKDSWKEELKKYLCGFYSVGVRESNAVEYFNKLTPEGLSAEVCIDPTFLLDKDEYLKLSTNGRIIEEPYIVYYSINNDPGSMELAQELGKYTGLKVYAIYSRMSSIFAFKYGMKTICDAGPREFLSLLANAEYVATNSFHGTALSLILEKQLVRLGKIANNIVVRDDRIDSLLEITGLENRTVIRKEDIATIVNKPIEWKNVRDLLAQEIEKSKDFLKRNICE